MVLGVLGEEEVNVVEVDDATAAVVVVLTAEGTGVKVVRAVVVVALSELDAPPVLL